MILYNFLCLMFHAYLHITNISSTIIHNCSNLFFIRSSFPLSIYFSLLFSSLILLFFIDNLFEYL